MRARLFFLFKMIILLISFIILFLWGIFSLPQMGGSPTKAALLKIQTSPNYRGGQFQNLTPTRPLTKAKNQSPAFLTFLFPDNPRLKPNSTLPSEHLDLSMLDPKEDTLVWMGHSSYLLQIDGARILVDPSLSGYASPFPFMLKNFPGSNPYSPEDIPNIDFLLITHDHYDHLDYGTAKTIQPRVGKVVTGLGVGAHLKRWGYAKEQIIEKDWGDDIDLGSGFKLKLAPARHFSGRTFKRNQTLWTAFILTTPSKKIYIGGDGGYDTHFKEIGISEGPFDLAILENGQYNENWRYIHETPEEAVQAALDLNAKVLMPVHWGKFVLSVHDWDEPIKRISLAAQKANMPLLTPIIGAKTNLDAPITPNSWWEKVQ